MLRLYSKSRKLGLLLVLGCLWASLADAAPVRTGTPFSVTMSTANTGSGSVSIPADATFLVCGMSGYSSTASIFSGGSMTIGGAAMTMGTAGDTGTDWKNALFYKVSPATGTQTLAWDWSGTGTLTEAGFVMCATYKALDTASPVRSIGCVQTSTSPYNTGSRAASAGDLAVIVLAAFVGGGDITFSFSNSTAVTQFTIAGNAEGAWAEASPTTATTFSASGVGSDDGSMCAVVLKPAAAGTPHRRRDMMY